MFCEDMILDLMLNDLLHETFTGEAPIENNPYVLDSGEENIGRYWANNDSQ